MPPAIAVPFQVLPRLPLVVAFTALLVVRPATGASQAIPTERGSVADWGGEGPLLSFLPGFGTGAHIFDGLAPAFTDHFHVIALTPRGFPPSSAPDAGYTIAQLAADVLGVVDSSQARQAVLAGHSISGAVITRFAEAYPDRLLAAVYLDAAFDFGAAYRRSRLRPRLDVSSIDTTAARYRGWKAAYPDWDPIREGDARMWDVDSADAAHRQALVLPLADEVRSHPHEFWKVQVPALAICAVGSMRRAYGWLTPDSTRWQVALAWGREAQAAKRAECREFRRRVPHGQSVELDGGHFIFLDRRDAVVRAMRRFFRAVLSPP